MSPVRDFSEIDRGLIPGIKWFVVYRWENPGLYTEHISLDRGNNFRLLIYMMKKFLEFDIIVFFYQQNSQ